MCSATNQQDSARVSKFQLPLGGRRFRKFVLPLRNRPVAPMPHTAQHSAPTYTGWAKKTAPNFSCNNFGKYGPILIMFSLLHSQMN